MRTGAAATRWARENADRPPAGSGLGNYGSDVPADLRGTWYRMCLQYVRASFGLPGGTPDAGKAWDWAKHKHPETDPAKIPGAVPVFWELPSVADHVAYSVGGGWCLSTDARRRGAADRVRIDDITRAWGGRLLGWTEDLQGQRIWTPPKPEPRTPNITAALTADTWPEREAALRRVAARGSRDAKAAASGWLAAHAAREAANQQARAARQALKALERP